MTNKVLIIGGTGFLGKNVIFKLQSLNFNIISISRKKKLPKNKRNIKYLSLNIFNKKEFNKIKKINFDYIFNFGGNINHKNSTETYKAHYLGVKNMINSLNFESLKYFVQIGSSLEYGESVSPQSEKSKCDPCSFYGKAKLKASKFLISKFKMIRKKIIILRPYQVYGPYQKFDRLVPHVIKNCLRNNNFNCTQGNQLRDFLYIDDFVNLLVKILRSKKVKSGIYNVGYGKPIKVNLIINKINSLVGKGKPIFGKIKMRKDEINSLYPNIKKIKKRLKWRPKINLEKGLKKTIEYYKNV